MEATRIHTTSRSNCRPIAPSSQQLVSSLSANKSEQPKYVAPSDRKMQANNRVKTDNVQHDQRGAAEIAKCYQEVDQIYDFIRGLAPLPLELRRIKSIDFECERSKRSSDSQKPIKTISNADKQSTKAEPTTDSHNNRGDQLRSRAKSRDSANLFRRLLPLKVTGGNVGPQIKKVESLAMDKTSEVTQQVCERLSPQLQAKSRQDKHRAIEPIKLPRAQSTSNLHQTRQLQTTSHRRHLISSNLKPTSQQQVSNLLLWNPNVPLKLSSATRPTSMVIQTLPTPSSSHLKRPQLIGSKPLGIGDRFSSSIRMIDNASQPTSMSTSPTQLDDDNHESPINKRHNFDLNLVRRHRASRNVTSSPKSQTSSKLHPSAASISSDAESTSSSNSVSETQSTSSNSSLDQQVKKGDHMQSSASIDTSSSSSSADTTTASSSESSSQSDTTNSSSSKSESEFEPELSQKKSFTEATKNKKRKQISTTTSASSRANEIEKSPSDYENDTTSFMSSDRCETPASRDDAKLVESRSSSSGRPSSPQTTNQRSDIKSRRRHSRSTPSTQVVADDVQSEHIYEQIPALKNLAPPNRDDHDQSQASSHRHHHHNHHHHHHHQAKPFVYPVAYAHDIGHRYSQQNAPRPMSKHAQHAYIASTKGGLMAAQSLNRLNTIHDMHNSLPIYPNHQNLDRRRAKAAKLHPVHNFMFHPLFPVTSSSSREAPILHYKDNMNFRQHDPKPQRQLSMNNLHLIPFMNPIGAQYSSRHLNSGGQSLQRSSSSTRVNLRAPRVTPGQLVAQTVMQLNSPSNRRHAFLMWQPSGQQASRQETSVLLRQSAQLSEYPSYLTQPSKPTNITNSNSLMSKRRNPRRLTAIGIEQAYLPAARNLVDGYQSKSKRYFEPVQLVGAPLIDEDDEAEMGNQTPTHCKPTTVSSKVRPLDSISDLQSDSSSSGQYTTPDVSSLEDAQPQLANLDKSRPPNKSANSRQRKSSDDNFVSSSSFIKCYYGRELDDLSSAQEQPKRLPTREATNKSNTSNKQTPPTTRKKSGGDKLLGLIGLSPVSSGPASKRQTVKSASLFATNSPLGGCGLDKGCKEPQQTSSNRLAANATSKPAKPATPIRLFEHPTVRVARLAAGNESYKPHKLQKQAASRSSDKSPSAKESPISAASLRKRLANVLALGGSGQGNKTSSTTATTATRATDQQSDSNTNDSTSSYEAAIKNGQGESQSAAATKESEEPGTKPKQAAPSKPEKQPKVEANSAGRSSSGNSRNNANSNGAPPSQLIKVPKLSKQSHLLSRPLPTPPPAHSSTSRANSSAHWLSAGCKSHTQAGSQRLATQNNSHGLASAKARKSAGSNAAGNHVNYSSKSNGANSKGSQSAEHPRPRSNGTSEAGKSHSSCNKFDASPKATRLAGDASSQSLSPLAVAINGNTQHSSPTVTTCTSSGISSRLTVGTHLAANSNSIGSNLSQRALAAKQKVQHQHQIQASDKLSSGVASSGSGNHSKQQPVERDSFALMDEQCDDPYQSAASRQYNKPPDKNTITTDDFVMRPQPKTTPTSMAKRRMVSPTSELGDDNNLKRFDEKFSNSKFSDNQLASSEDSLLESIDAITQQPNRNKQQQPHQLQPQTFQPLEHPSQVYKTNKPIITITQRQCI